ncbi:MAG: D-sedoheptulose 7-phosphate isomerase [Saprospiraceae bacterium]|jgi:D-sedoheptulose 7-phosphate isomerase|nr:D-sedoheptulose 7-phosphate isomerase [Saprospiraceae bacterium]MBK8296939.1 D-sedoheptulose 7-phosphate isomerase [Saprospiraceae bacterium]
MKEIIREIIQESIQVKLKLLSNELIIEQLEQVSLKIIKSLQKGKRIYFCGNGGSAADAQHLAAELSGRFYTDRLALPAEALHCNTSYLTAVANDYSYEVVYQRLIEGIGQEDDILIGLSTSGNSKNIIRAIESANAKNMITIGLTGSKGGQLKEICQFWIGVPSDDTPRIQESHILLGHIICQMVEERIFNS